MTSVVVVNNHEALFGGAERQISELANYLTDHNYKVTIASTVMCPEFKQSLKEARICETGTDQGLLEFVAKYARKFDIVNPHNHPTELFHQYTQKNKVVWQCNEVPGYVLEGKEVDPNERAYINRTISKVMVITDFDRARFKTLYGQDAITNYPGVHYDFFAKDVKVRNTLNMKDNFVITQVNYFTWTKQQDKSIEIFAKVKKDIPEAKLVLVGFNAWATQYPFVKKVHDKIEELGLEDDVFISDYLQGDENLRNIYNQTDVCLQPVLAQGAYATVFEGISAGIPSVVSEDFVASSLVLNNQLGWLSSQSIDEYANKICMIYSDYQRCKEETMEYRSWIKDNLTWEKFGENYCKVFEGVLSS